MKCSYRQQNILIERIRRHKTLKTSVKTRCWNSNEWSIHSMGIGYHQSLWILLLVLSEIAYTLCLVYRCAKLQRRWHPFYITVIENRMCKHSWSLKCCGETRMRKKNCRQFLPTTGKCSLRAMVNFQKDSAIFEHLFQMVVLPNLVKQNCNYIPPITHIEQMRNTKFRKYLFFF